VNDAELRHIAEGGGIPDLSERLAQRGSSPPWKDLRTVFCRRKLWGIYIGQFGLSSTLWFYLTWFPTYLIRYRHIALTSAGLLASLPFLSAFLGVLSGGFLSDWLLRRGHSLTVARKVPIVTGLLLASMIAFATGLHRPVLIVTCMACSFFGCGLASITWSVVSTIAPERLIGLTGGVFNSFSNLAAILVPIMVGALIRGDNFSRALLFVSSMAIAGMLSYVFLVGRIERISEQQGQT
jgi:ACS family D-galactonate transporter-like MFS transporter